MYVIHVYNICMHMYVCVCVCTCVCARVRVCVCVHRCEVASLRSENASLRERCEATVQTPDLLHPHLPLPPHLSPTHLAATLLAPPDLAGEGGMGGGDVTICSAAAAAAAIPWGDTRLTLSEDAWHFNGSGGGGSVCYRGAGEGRKADEDGGVGKWYGQGGGGGGGGGAACSSWGHSRWARSSDVDGPGEEEGGGVTRERRHDSDTDRALVQRAPQRRLTS
jgi:hypothetical protein